MLAVNGLGGSGLGLSTGEIGTLIQKLGPHLDTIALVVNDPLFPSLMDRVKTLSSMKTTLAGGGLAAPQQTSLLWAVRGLDAVIYAKRNPWAVGVVGAGAVLFLLSIGFAMGSRRRK